MREGSALLERLEKRFEAIDNRADRRSIGIRERDSFLGHFADRMQRLKGLVQIPEMSAFKRLPKEGSRFDPWGNMGGWSVIQDLTYLKWLDEQELEEEEIEQPRVSAWGTATSSRDPHRQRSSAWLNTPYTPARVAGKPLPKPQTRKQGKDRNFGRPVKRVKTPVGGRGPLNQRRSTASAPMLSPLKRALGRATVAQERRGSSARVMNSLPPVLAKTVGAKWVNEKERSNSRLQKGRRTERTSLQSPMFKVLEQDVSSSSQDSTLSPSRLASERMRVPSQSNLLDTTLASYDGSNSLSSDFATSPSSSVGNRRRGLRTPATRSDLTSQVIGTALSPNNGSRGSSNGKRTNTSFSLSGSLDRMAYEKVERIVEVSVPALVKRKVQDAIQRLSSSSQNKSGSSETAVVEQVIEVVEELVLKQAYHEVKGVFSNAKITSLDDLMDQTGSMAASVKRIERVVRTVTQQLIRQNESIVEDVVQATLSGQSAAQSKVNTLSSVPQSQIQTVVKRLQSKGVSRSFAERVVKSLPVNTLDVQDSMDALVEQVIEMHADVENARGSTAESFGNQSRLQTSQIEKQVRRRLAPLLQRIDAPQGMNRLTERGSFGQSIATPSKSLLPSVAGEHFSERIIADVVNQIANYANRETMIEGSVGQRQLMGSLERTVSQLVSKTRTMNIPSDVLDWVDVQPFGQSAEEHFSNTEGDINASKSSPWFTGPSSSSSSSASNRSVNQRSSSPSQPSFQLQPVQQAAARVLNMVQSNPTRPDVVARYTGLKIREVQNIVATLQGIDVPINQQSSLSASSVDSKVTSTVTEEETSTNRLSSPHSLESLWDRATSPIALPEWTGMGTSSFKPMIGESAKGWRLSPKRRPMHPYAVDIDSTVLQPGASSGENEIDGIEGDASEKQSPWFTSNRSSESNTVGFGFVPQSISGDAKLSSNEIAMFGQTKSVELTVSEVRGQKARWLEPNRTVILDNGTVIHAKVAKRLGLAVKSASKQNLPLSWTLEGLQLKSDHKSMPSWAKRASGRPQVNASQDFLMALAKTANAEEVAEVILQNSGRSQNGVLPRTAMTAIDQIRREAHRSLQDIENAQQDAAESLQQNNRRQRGRDRTRRRTSRTAGAVMGGLTGLKPISTAGPSSSGASNSVDKVSKLTKQLESLVSLAESNQRDEAREGVRMAEESHDAIAEGQSLSKGEERDYAVDIDALRQEVMSAFEQEMSIRSLRSFDNSNNTDPWW